MVTKCLFVFSLCCYVAFVDNMHITLNDSPCPETFEYATDSRNELFGRILVRNPSQSVIRLNVELSIGNSLNGYNGKIELEYPKAQIIDDVLNGRPILYKVHFPVWRRFPPRITKILANGNLICSGPPLNIKLVPVLTTVNLQHTLRINVSSGLAPASPDYPFYTTSFSSRPDENSFDDISKPPENEYPENPFFQLTTSKPAAPNQIITFVVPSSTTERPPALQPTPDIDVRNDNLEEVCGKSLAANHLISYGETVTRGLHPWLAALYVIENLGLRFICGGNLISTKHVLTAAHCMRKNGKKIRTDDLLVILGKHNIQQWIDNQSQMLYAREITIHKDYKDLSADADIAMITLIEQVQFKTFIRPICLWSEPSSLELIVGEMGIVAGWGKDENGVQISAEAKQVILPIVGREECRSSQETLAEVVTSRTFCAGFRNGSGPCNGDSGGGFVMERGGKWTLRGLVSLSLYDSLTKCDLTQYLVFTDVTKFSTWIRAFLQK